MGDSGDPRDGVFGAAQFHSAIPDGVEFHYWHQARCRVVEARLRELGAAAASRVLEIGCGRGVVVDYLRGRGFEVLGCELGDAEPIRAEVGPHVRVGVDAFELPASYRHAVTAILLLDVLEHIARPSDFLAQCRASFPALQAIVATLPARQELYSNYDKHYGHHLRYDLNSLRALADAAHLELATAGYFFHALYPAARLQQALARGRPLVVRAPRRPPARLLHRALGALFALESRALPPSLPGTSLYAVLR